jgi:hypothetical protein
MTNMLTAARHTDRASYWEGGHYELNLSFDTLRDRQWQRVMQTLWSHSALNGPLAERYIPGGEASELISIQVPPPTATLTQHGQMKIGSLIIGCDVQATRSLFECVSVLVPLGMFAGIAGSPQVRRDHSELDALDKVLYDMALRAYDVAPYKIAAIGYERGCQLPAELRSSEMRDAFLAAGGALAQEEVLQAINVKIADYEQVRPNLRWLPPTSQE